MKSIFIDKDTMPTTADLERELGTNYEYWQSLICYTKESYPSASEQWKFSSEKFGWGFRLSDKKRVLIHLLPRDGFFKVALVFGQKATELILASTVSEDLKNELKAAKVYAEGRGIRVEVKNKSIIDDIKKLIAIKIAVT
jgi:hypothetical protein